MQNVVAQTLVAMAMKFGQRHGDPVAYRLVYLRVCLYIRLSIDSAPARSLLFFVVDSVCMSVCL